MNTEPAIATNPDTTPAVTPSAPVAPAAETAPNAPATVPAPEAAPPKQTSGEWKAKLWPQFSNGEFDLNKRPTLKVEVPPDTVCLDYEFVLRGGNEEIVRVKSQLVLPMALEVENLAQTDLSFPELFDRVIVRPLVTRFHAYLEKRFEVADRIAAEKEAAAKPRPPTVQPSFTIPRPAIGTDIVPPEMKATPPPPRMPGGFAQSFPRNGS